ncbi:LamG domain-containing protein [Candidatus Woesearchaeota archaeon]|nr:LamG domain-containing protein [Candidatus Woesearchaeota archaeon]MBW2994392.1 LamG domain-containing protein [Candidatus Woesearchaeota archaeon]
MNLSKKVFLVCLAVTLFLVALKISSDFPTGLGIYYGNTSATNPEGTIRFSVATQVLVTLLNPPDNTIFTIPGATTDVSLTCRATNLSGPVNITQIRLYTDISGAFIITDVINVTGSSPHTVTFNVSAVPIGTYRWNCEAVTPTSLTRAPSDWRFTIRKSGGGGGGGGGGGTPWLEPPIVEQPEYRECVLPPHGLVSWFTFDNTTDDFWNYSRTGNMIEEPRFIERDYKDWAIDLNGFTEQVIVTPENTYNNLINGTIDGWVFYRPKNNKEVIFSYADVEKSGVAAKYLLLQINSAGNLEFVYKDGPTHRVVQPEFSFNFNKHSNEWVHITLTYAKGRYEWYINGQHYGAVTTGSTGVPGYWFHDLTKGTELVATIGAISEKGSITGQFKGGLDEIEIYNRALSPTEIHAIYTRSKCKIRPATPLPPTIAEVVEDIEQALEKPVLYLPFPRKTLPLWIFAIALIAIALIIFFLSRSFLKKEKPKTKIRTHSVKKKKRKKKK